MIDHTNGVLDQELAFAQSIQDPTLQKCIDRLKQDEETYSCKPTAHLYTDFLPHCFEFTLVKDERIVLNGGLIFHGKAGELQNFSVQIEPCGGWQIHT